MSVHLPLPGPLRTARFVERPNRFLLRCRLGARDGPQAVEVREGDEVLEVGEGDGHVQPSDELSDGRARPGESGSVVDVHLPDPGRLNELLIPGKPVWIRWAASPTRKTDWSAVLVESPDGEGLVSVDTTLPNRLIHRALEAGALAELEGWELERREFPLGDSRIDFLLRRDGRRLALEVKSVTLVEDGVALFPDAVTARGARHVRELAEVAGSVDDEGRRWEAAVLFVLQRSDAARIEAARSIDPEFADALAEAEEAGVRVLGRRCRVSEKRLELAEPVPARTSP